MSSFGPWIALDFDEIQILSSYQSFERDSNIVSCWKITLYKHADTIRYLKNSF